MRLDILALAVLGVGRLALAVAADPAPATPPERAAAPATAVTDSASSAKSATTGVPAPAPSPATSAPAAPKGAAPELSAAENRLINLGYKPQMRNGEKIYCRREAPMGSRISSGQHCGTVAELATTTQEGREGLEKTQRNTVNPMPH
jgi:hypothetical protein